MSCIIENGEYVRTKSGSIVRVLEAFNNMFKDKDDDVYLFSEVAKHSFDIKDILKSGDYVNGYEISEFDDEEGNLYLGIPIFDDAEMNVIVEARPIDTLEIVSIVTKEQFEKLEFKL